jgi:hypothetical protein
MAGDGSIGRRRFMTGAVGTVASACIVGTIEGPASTASARARRNVQPAPTPIPGGLDIGGGLVIHTYGPGDPTITLPFTGFVLGGFDVEPGTITDFDGSSAVAFHVGTAQGSDGRTYNLETDLRAYEGSYVVDGQEYRGSFALV